MIYYMHNISKPYILSVDVEYDKNKLVQVGAIMLKNVGENLYQICRSFNVYIKDNSVSRFVQEYTNITEEFLKEYGVTKEQALLNWHSFIDEFNADDVVVISHGIHQDSIILKENGFDINYFEHWCTYNMSGWVLERNHALSLGDVAREFGLIPISEHNAYADALTTVHVFSVLLKLDGDD